MTTKLFAFQAEMFANDPSGSSDPDRPPNHHQSCLRCQKSDSISAQQILWFKSRQRRGRLKSTLTSLVILLAFVALAVEARPQPPEGKKIIKSPLILAGNHFFIGFN